MSPAETRPTRARQANERDVEDAATAPAEDLGGGLELLRALYVTGPGGGARYVLPTGLVTLGRGAEATIVVADPRVSRAHAALHVSAEMMLSDLGSANGTFLGRERLPAADACPLADGQSFFIGDSALVVRPCSLRRADEKRFASVDELAARIARTAANGERASVAVIKIRPLRPVQKWSLEAILGELPTSPRDFLGWLDPEQLVLGLELAAQGDVPRIEGDVIRRLAAWSQPAEVTARLLSSERLEQAGDGLRALLAGDEPLILQRGKVVLEHSSMKVLEQTVARVASSSVNVLVLGETGVGKDVFAAMLHELSPRANAPFVVLNCASLPEQLLESELFGHERGAFTGALAAKPGLFEAAHGGTVFLDEVGELPLSLQAKLLRVLESREVTRLGALKPRVVDVRFVAATNRELARSVAQGHFRQDLYYRLNSVTLAIPPLRERASEIEPLARLFLKSACERFEIGEMQLANAALEALLRHTWPGNVRELKSAVERAALLARGSTVEVADLGLLPLDPSPSSAPVPVPTVAALEEPGLERERIIRALEECGGNQSRAAKRLDMSRRTLVRRITELGLPRPRE